MALVISAFSVTALAADKLQESADNPEHSTVNYENMLKTFEESQPSLIESEGTLNKESSTNEQLSFIDAVNAKTGGLQETPIQEYYETEVNDVFTAANIINDSYAGIPEYFIYGQIDNYQDVDIYRFSVTTSGTVEVFGFWNGDHANQGLETELLLGLFDSSLNLVDAYSECLYLDDGTAYRLFIEELSAGTYYLATLQDDTYPNMFVGEDYCLGFNFWTDVPTSVSYQSHVESIGWQDWCSNGGTSGTSGKSLRLEAMRISMADADGGVEYQTHVQNIGWQDWVADGELSGTSGKSLRLEAIKIRLTGEISKHYDIYYRVHAQSVGWMGWTKNGEASGTAGFGYRLEAIEIRLVRKGAAAPGSTAMPFKSANPNEQPSNPVQPSNPDPEVNVSVTEHSVRYQTHVQDVGWQGWKRNGEMAGTSGKSLRLEGMYIEIEGVDNAIEYRTHVQDIGWQGWVSDGTMTGTSARSLRLEAIDIRLTGEIALKYDIYYRVHAQNVGWMGWAKNGQSAGTAGFSYRLEGIQVVLVDKGGPAPGGTADAFLQK
jgi:uncharacterized protein YjdB